MEREFTLGVQKEEENATIHHSDHVYTTISMFKTVLSKPIN